MAILPLYSRSDCGLHSSTKQSSLTLLIAINAAQRIARAIAAKSCYHHLSSHNVPPVSNAGPSSAGTFDTITSTRAEGSQIISSYVTEYNAAESS